MNSITKLAILKSITERAAEEARDLVSPGVWDVDVLVRVHGVVTVEKDHEQPNPQRLCPWTLLLVALNHLNGATVDSLVLEAAQLSKTQVEDLKRKTKKAAEKLLGKTVKTQRGAVRFNGVLEDVSMPVEARDAM
jgi:hypothetical protein